MTENNIQPQRGNTARLIFGVLLVILGAIFLFDTLEYIDFNITHIVFSWPSILFIIGLITFVKANNKTLGAILMLIGGLFLIPRIFPNVQISGDIVFPLIIIFIGLLIIVKGGFRRFNGRIFSSEDQKEFSSDRIDEIAIFGGGEKNINSPNFKGGNITAIFGGSEINLSNASLAPGQNVIDVLAIFGGCTLIIPQNWNLVVDVFPIFGGFSNKIIRSPEVVVDTTKTLIIKGTVIFGGGEIKAYK
jgi:predicted membrane protein